MLKSFVRVMEKPSLAEGEECDICMTEIQIEDARRLITGPSLRATYPDRYSLLVFPVTTFSATRVFFSLIP